MTLRAIKTASVLLLLVSSRVFAEDGQFAVPPKEVIGEVVKSLDQTLKKFECKYIYSTKILPGYSAWLAAAASSAQASMPPVANKDGFNEIYEILYKRSGDAFYLKLDNQFSGAPGDITEFHSDGILFWENRHVNKRVNILSQVPALPFLYDNLLKIFPGDQSQYSNPVVAKNALETLLQEQNSKVKIVPNPDGTIEVQIVQPSKNPIPGMKVLHRLSIALDEDFAIKRYAFGGIFQQDDREHIFHPTFDVEFSKFQESEAGAPKIPAEMKLTEYRMKNSSFPKNIDELIGSDKNWIPIKSHKISMKEFRPNPKFANGEINFFYPVGTEVVDMFAKRVYLTGDTVEILREKVQSADK